MEHSDNSEYVGNQERPSFYEDGAKYWEGIEATVEGMLGGFADISDIDTSASKRFLREFCEVINSFSDYLDLYVHKPFVLRDYNTEDETLSHTERSDQRILCWL